MNWSRIYALFLRHWYPLRRDFDILTDMLYWPILDTITWGLASSWLTADTSGTSSAVLSILVALVMWNVLWRSQMEISRNLIDEIWNQNLVNLFSTPLTLREWIVSTLIQSVIKMVLAAGVISLVILLLYATNIYTLGWWLLPFVLNTILTGWCVGFIAASIVISYGSKMQTVVWTLPAVLFPLSAVYFPVTQLPMVVQVISHLVPTTYVFEEMRNLLFTQQVNISSLWLSFGLNIVYLILAIWFFQHSFQRSRKKGLGRFTA